MRLRDYSWSRSGKLATKGTVIPGSLVGVLQEVALQADFQKDHDDHGSDAPGAGYYTVEFAVQPPGSGSCNPEAEILWSVGGNNVRRQISVINGAVISGAGQNVTVRVTDNTLALVAQPYNVDILVIKGTRPSEEQPPRLTFPRTLNGVPTPPGPVILVPGPNGNFEIPLNAGVISFNCQANRETPTIQRIQPGDLLIEMFGGGLLKAVVDGSDSDGWIPLPPGVDTFVLQSNYAVGNLRAFIQLGIEG